MWKCSQCASCCKLAGLIVREWDRGDGACKYLQGNLCSIYENRPEICRVKDYTKEKELNMACEILRRIVSDK